MSVSTGPELADYQLHLSGFEGPLDVLLRLIEQQQLAISDLSLVQVTDGFLDHIDQLRSPSPVLLAEFAAIAARLLVLKSRALLPRLHEEVEDIEVDDLTEQLREYQRAKRVAAVFREREETAWRSFDRASPPPAPEVNLRFDLPSLGQVREALLRALARQPNPAEVAPIRRMIPVAEMARRLIGALSMSRLPRRFVDILNTGSRDEHIAGFVAMLALWNRQELAVQQDELFGDIYLSQMDPASQES